MTDARKVIKRVRRIPKPRQKRNRKIDAVIAKARNDKLLREMWERDKKVKREASFEKAKRMLEIKRREASEGSIIE